MNTKLHGSLERQETFYRTLFVAINDGIIVTDQNLVITRVNKAMMKIIGYSENELVGKKINDGRFSLVNEHSHKPVASFNEIVLKQKESISSSSAICIRNKNGQEIPIRINVSPIFDENKTITSIATVISDLRLERSRKQVIFNNAESFKNIFNSIDKAIILLDKNKNILMINDAGLVILKINSIENVLNKNIGSFFNHEDLEKAFDKAYNGNIQHIIVNIHHEDEKQSELYISLYPSQYFCEDIVVALIDNKTSNIITDEIDILTTFDKEYLINRIPVAIAFQDSEGTIKYLTFRFASLFGYQHDELIGKNIDSIIAKYIQPDKVQSSSDILNKDNMLYTAECVTKNGKIVYYQMRDALISFSHKETGIITIVKETIDLQQPS